MGAPISSDALKGTLVRPARPEDGDELASRLRDSDLFEMRAVGGSPGRLGEGILRSSPCWAALVDGQVEGLWGVGLADADEDSTAWFLQSGALTPRQLARHAPVWLARMLREAGHDLWNVVPAGSVAERWLEHLGALVNREYPYQLAGSRFHSFVLPHSLLEA